jgi:hypothetical protein
MTQAQSTRAIAAPAVQIADSVDNSRAVMTRCDMNEALQGHTHTRPCQPEHARHDACSHMQLPIVSSHQAKTCTGAAIKKQAYIQASRSDMRWATVCYGSQVHDLVLATGSQLRLATATSQVPLSSLFPQAISLFNL